WERIRKNYQPLIPQLTQHADLEYVLHEVAGELQSGHIYVQRADDSSPVPRKPGGMLGAEISADASGYFKIARIYPGENWNPARRWPLTEPGVGVKAGEYIVAVDGIDAKSVKNFYALLENKGERQVELRVNGKPSPDGARTVRVKTITNERQLRYLAWVAERRALVDRLSGGRIGYIHVPNTSTEGNKELAKQFEPYAYKEALIIDDRFNGGGFIPDRMIEILARQPLN